MKTLSVLGLLSVVLMVGCQEPSQRLNSPPQGDTVNRNSMQEPFQSMVDNSALDDMSVADIHFAGSTARLSGTGEYRLSKLAQVCKKYGGQVRYDTRLQDDKLLQERLKSVEQYLSAAGCDMDKCSVRLGMAATAEMPAGQAMKAQQAGLPADGGSGAGGQGQTSKSSGGNGNYGAGARK